VISRTSVMEYKDTTKNMRDIARELGVANILEGGIQRSGNQVRINVQLIDAATDEHLWAEIYDRELTAENLFVIQSEISKAIAQALQATLSPEEQLKVSEVRTRNFEAYESYLLGRKLWTERTAESNAEARRQFQRAIDLDPAFAQAYAGLADAYRFAVFYEGAKTEDALPQARKAVDTALQLDDQLGEVYASRATIRRGDRDLAGAEADFRRALELSPNYGPAYHWYAMLLADQGRLEEAVSMLEKGLELDPLSAVIRYKLSDSLEGLGRFDESQGLLERLIELHPDSRFGYIGLADTYAMVRGRLDESLVMGIRGLQLDPSNSQNMAQTGALYFDLGDAASAEKWLEFAVAAQPDGVLFKIWRLYILRASGDLDQAAGLAGDLLEFFYDTGTSVTLPLDVLRDVDIVNQRYDVALRRYAEIFPEIVESADPEVTRSNYNAAEEIAYLLIRAGEEQRARRLLEKVMPVIDSLPLLGSWGNGVGKARSLALLGEDQQALDELRRGVDAGWRFFWRYEFDADPLLDSLRGTPEFQALRARVAADMAEQLAHVRELEASGEIVGPGSLGSAAPQDGVAVRDEP
jgi:tetratricopeptide (TPR) repeat protein